MPIPLIVITGPVGAGKTTVADTMQLHLAHRGIVTAFIDQDALRMVQPTPPGDRFGAQLGYDNLAAIWPNLVRAGVQVVVIADVVEDRQESRCAYLTAMPGAEPTIVRLNVPMNLVFSRLRHRERTPQDLAWSLNRAPELQEIMEAGAVEDLLIDVGQRSPEEIANEIIDRLGLDDAVSSVENGASSCRPGLH